MRRRLWAGTLAAPLLWWLLSSAGGGLGATTSAAWITCVALASVASSATLASYVPTSGHTPAWGCTSCAVVAAASVPVAAALLASAPGEVPFASLALVVTTFGFAQRLRDPRTCPTGPTTPA
ncbi:MAG: hypothetical protein L6311_08800 [Cellulomonas sp.]|nr:hypothetical protein [Cellulomonas sp.]